MQMAASSQALTRESAQQQFVQKVFGWMGLALLTTAAVSYSIVGSQELLMAIVTNRALFFGLIIAELVVVMVLSAAVNRLSATMATGLFFLYAGLTGATLSVVFIAYTAESLVTTFLITAGTFGAMAIYGYVTKRDLTSVGNLAFMGLIGIIIASVVNLFLKSSMLSTAVAYIGVILFVGLTAYDAQKIKQLGATIPAESDTERKGAIIGALTLYLDFINLFLLLLRLVGRRR